MTANYYKKERFICSMCKTIQNVDENGRCYKCKKVAIEREEENKEYNKQLRLSMGLS